MGLDEAVTMLENSGYLLESPEFNAYEEGRLGDNYRKNRENRKALSAKGPESAELKSYDDMGKKWVYVNKRDRMTLLTAFMDGQLDMGEHLMGYDIGDLVRKYRAAKTEEDIITLWNKYFVTAGAGEDLHGKFDAIYAFLASHMKGRTRVYRGLRISSAEYARLAEDPRNRLGKYLVKKFSNTTKPYNSFTTDPRIAARYAMEPLEPRKYYDRPDDYRSIVISADAEPNDINFAFTAYLYGLYDKDVDENYELNVSNMKELANFRVERYVEPREVDNAEYERSVRADRRNMTDYEIDARDNEDIISDIGEDPDRYKVVMKNNHYNIFDTESGRTVYGKWFKRLYYDGICRAPFQVASDDNKYNYITDHFRLLFDEWLDEPMRYNTEAYYTSNPEYYFEIVVNGQRRRLDRDFRPINKK